MRCSLTVMRTGGRSNTCRASIPTTGARRRPAPHPSQRSGRCTCTRSGSGTCRNVKPGSPGCLPGNRPDGSRRDRGGALPGPSADGGFDDVRDVNPNRRLSSAFSARNSSITRACSATNASNTASRSSSSTMDGVSGTTNIMRYRSAEINCQRSRNHVNSYFVAGRHADRSNFCTSTLGLDLWGSNPRAWQTQDGGSVQRGRPLRFSRVP
jgi:hypothetical protein